MLLLYLKWRTTEKPGSLLYIPLCFYYIELTNPNVQTVAIFTFHYASTISYAGSLSLFAHLPLHSTMLLLYLGGLSVSIFIKVLYIPLCFYYICLADFLVRSMLSLHSTMLLLYRCRFQLWCPVLLPLHSTMLLLYPDRKTRSTSE